MANRDFSIDLRLRTEFAKANADINRAGAELNQLYESGTRADRALAQTISRYQQSSAAAAKLAADERRLKEAVDQGRISQETFSRSMGTLSAQRLQLAETATLGDRMRGAVATGVGSATAAMIGFATVTLSATAAMSAFNGAVDYADKLNDMTIRLGLSAEKVSAWGYAAKQTGTDIDGLGLGMKKLLDNMGNAAANPKGSQAQMFKDLGISVVDATGKIKDLETIVPEIADKFQGLSSEAEKTQVAMDLFGKSGTDLIEFLSLGSDGLSNMELRARELGMVFSQETLTAADAFNDSLGDLQAVTQGYISQLTAGMLPALQGMVAGMADAAAGGSDLREVGQSLATAISYGIDVLTVFTRLAETLGVVAGAAAVGVQALADAGNAITRLDFSQAGASLGRFRANLGMAGTEINNIWARDTIGETMRFSLAKGPDRSGTPRPASFGSLAEENAWRRTQGLRPLLSSPDYPQAAAASGGSTPTPTRTGGGGRRARSGGGAGAAVSDAQRLAQQAQQRIDQLKEEVALAGLLTDGETKLTNAQRARYDTTEGKWKSLAPKLKEELIAAAEAKDAMLKAADAKKKDEEASKKAAAAYDKLRDSLRTPAEVALEKAIEETDILNAALEKAKGSISDAERATITQGIARELTPDQPQFEGLAPEVGGAFGEFQKMQQAQAEEEKWYQDALNRQREFLSQKSVDAAAGQAEIERITALHQQRVAAIEGSKQQAMLSMAGSFFGQLATLQNSKNKTMQRIGKAAAIAQTVISTYQSATQAYAAMSGIPYIGPALGIAAAAAAVAAGLANVQQIRSQPEGYATGGYTGDGGKYEPAGVVHRGEFVVRKEVTRSPRVRAMLENLNQNGSAALYGWTQYADGGLVSLPSQPMGNLDRVSPSLNIPAPKINQQTVVVFDEDAVSRTVAANQHMETRILRVIAENPRALGGG